MYGFAVDSSTFSQKITLILSVLDLFTITLFSNIENSEVYILDFC